MRNNSDVRLEKWLIPDRSATFATTASFASTVTFAAADRRPTVQCREQQFPHKQQHRNREHNRQNIPAVPAVKL